MPAHEEGREETRDDEVLSDHRLADLLADGSERFSRIRHGPPPDFGSTGSDIDSGVRPGIGAGSRLDLGQEATESDELLVGPRGGTRESLLHALRGHPGRVRGDGRQGLAVARHAEPPTDPSPGGLPHHRARPREAPRPPVEARRGSHQLAGRDRRDRLLRRRPAQPPGSQGRERDARRGRSRRSPPSPAPGGRPTRRSPAPRPPPGSAGRTPPSPSTRRGGGRTRRCRPTRRCSFVSAVKPPSRTMVPRSCARTSRCPPKHETNRSSPRSERSDARTTIRPRRSLPPPRTRARASARRPARRSRRPPRRRATRASIAGRRRPGGLRTPPNPAGSAPRPASGGRRATRRSHPAPAAALPPTRPCRSPRGTAGARPSTRRTRLEEAARTSRPSRSTDRQPRDHHPPAHADLASATALRIVSTSSGPGTAPP